MCEMASRFIWSSSKGVSRNIHRSGLCVSAAAPVPSHLQPCCPPKVEQRVKPKEDREGNSVKERPPHALVSVRKKNSSIIVYDVFLCFLSLVVRRAARHNCHSTIICPGIVLIKAGSSCSQMSRF